MSRIGRKPINIPAGVEVKVDGSVRNGQGPEGHADPDVPAQAWTVAVEGAEIVVTRPNDDKENRALHGLTRTLIHNMVVGVTEGFKKELEVNGVGYRVAEAGHKPGYEPRFLASGHRSGNRRDQDRRSRLRTRSSSTASTSRRSASSPRKSARSDRRSRTRARASSTLTRLFAARKARPVRVNNRLRSEIKMVSKADKNVARLRRHKRVRGKISGTRGKTAPRCFPLPICIFTLRSSMM